MPRKKMKRQPSIGTKVERANRRGEMVSWHQITVELSPEEALLMEDSLSSTESFKTFVREAVRALALQRLGSASAT